MDMLEKLISIKYATEHVREEVEALITLWNIEGPEVAWFRRIHVQELYRRLGELDKACGADIDIEEAA